MSLKIPYNTPADKQWLADQNRRLKLESATYRRRTDPAPKAKKEYPVPQKYFRYANELESLREGHPFIHVPAQGTKSYLEDIRAVRAITLGLDKVLTPDEMNLIRRRMYGKTPPGNNMALFEPVLKKYFLDIEWDQETRRKLYSYLNKSLSREYGGDGKKMRLADMLRSQSGWSRVIWFWLSPPRPIMNQPPARSDEVRDEMEMALEIMPAKVTPEQVATLARNILSLKDSFNRDYRHGIPRGSEADYLYGQWRKFFSGFVDYLGDTGQTINPGWFHPGNRPIGYFLDDIGWRQPVLPPKPRGISSGLAAAGL